MNPTNFIVEFTLTNGELGTYEAVSPTATMAILDFTQWAIENELEVASLEVEVDEN